jgi:hypothetical protein
MADEIGAFGNTDRTHLTRNLRERCVMARVQRSGLRFYRCFALSRYTSWEAAEAAARLWLRPALARIALLPGDRPLSSRNRSGVAGVFFRPGYRTLRTGRFVSYPAYVARWPGALGGLKWSFNTSGGEDGAFLRACVSRELRSADRCRVEWVVRTLAPEKRESLLALRRPLSERFLPDAWNPAPEPALCAG